jgi:hypothetical protein
MEQTQCSETSAFKLQTLGNSPEESIQQVWDYCKCIGHHVINISDGCLSLVNGFLTIPFKLYILYKVPYTLSVKLSDFNVWHHTWQKNWVNCTVLTGNSAGLRTVISSHLSHREMLSSLRESHSFLSLPADTTTASSRGTQQNWQKNWQTWWEACAVPENIQFSFLCSFFTQLDCTV